MNRKEKAISYFKQSFNCSQAVFTAFRQEDAIDENAALRLSTVFGAGVACTGTGLCGAVSGALMAISMKYGREDVSGVDAKLKTYEMAKKFMDDFKTAQGSCICEEIIKINIGTPENLKKAADMKIFETKCLDAVKTSADLLEKIL
jgi:C_GCAxxG_C_C family probable redox protein